MLRKQFTLCLPHPKEEHCFWPVGNSVGELWGPHVCSGGGGGARLELRSYSARSPCYPLLGLSQATSCRKESGQPGLILQTPYGIPVGPAASGRASQRHQVPRSPPHLEEGGARPRCDVTAPGTSCGRLGGPRGPQGAWPGSPDQSRESSPQPGPDSLPPGPLASTSISNVARSASEGVGAGCRCETPRAPQPTASGSRPGAWLSAHCAQARIPLAPACWRRGRGRA